MRIHGAVAPRHSGRRNKYGEGPVAKLASVVDTQSKEFRANAAAMRALVRGLEDKRAEASLGGPQRSRERHVSRGKFLPRERVLRLIDPGTPFLELSPLAANGMYDDAIHGAGIITGIGRIEGRECVVVCNDATRSEEHTSELQSRSDLVCRLLLEKKKRLRTERAGRQSVGGDDRKSGP